jgi:drug/metabolite transporter (DMT)-like permease
LLWAFSFGLIERYLTGLPALLVAFLRLGISALLFLPWSLRGLPRRPRPPWDLVGRLLLLGAVQFGLMYGFYIAAYRYLPAYGVAFYTVFTPLYVAWLEDLRTGRWHRRRTGAAVLAVAGGALVLTAGSLGPGAWRGVALLQVSNLCFAAGQLGYRRLARASTLTESTLLGWMYVGAAALTGVAAALQPGAETWPSGTGWLVLLYLGAVPTGLGFYLWNMGAARVGAGLLAVANDAKIPLAVLVSWVVFGEAAAYGRVLDGLAIVILALVIAGGEEQSAGGASADGSSTRKGARG